MTNSHKTTEVSLPHLGLAAAALYRHALEQTKIHLEDLPGRLDLSAEEAQGALQQLLALRSSVSTGLAGSIHGLIE